MGDAHPHATKQPTERCARGLGAVRAVPCGYWLAFQVWAERQTGLGAREIYVLGRYLHGLCFGSLSGAHVEYLRCFLLRNLDLTTDVPDWLWRLLWTWRSI